MKDLYHTIRGELDLLREIRKEPDYVRQRIEIHLGYLQDERARARQQSGGRTRVLDEYIAQVRVMHQCAGEDHMGLCEAMHKARELTEQLGVILDNPDIA